MIIDKKLLYTPVKFMRRIMFRIKMYQWESSWNSMTCNSCFRLFPPSFYLTHSQEEIERITAKEIAELKEMVEQYKKAQKVK